MEKAQHCRADIDHVGFKQRICHEQPSQKSAIAVAQHQSAPRATVSAGRK